MIIEETKKLWEFVSPGLGLVKFSSVIKQYDKGFRTIQFYDVGGVLLGEFDNEMGGCLTGFVPNEGSVTYLTLERNIYNLMVVAYPDFFTDETKENWDVEYW